MNIKKLEDSLNKVIFILENQYANQLDDGILKLYMMRI